MSQIINEIEPGDKYNMAEIYKITSKTSGKSYIGQAMKYVSGCTKWGSIKRWKSHVYEALNSSKDHCTYLNNAIRKYGENDFVIEIVADNVPIEKINEKEIECIQKYNTLIPNGYNLKPGGFNGKLSDEVRIEKRNTKTKFIVRRKHDEDSQLPLFIRVRRRDGNIIGYRVDFPVPNSTTYEHKDFTCCKPTPEKLEDLFSKSKSYIDELKKKHNFDETKINIKKITTETVIKSNDICEIDDVDVNVDINDKNTIITEISKQYKKKDYKPHVVDRKIDGILGGYVVKYRNDDNKIIDKVFISNVLDEAKRKADLFLKEKLDVYNEYKQNNETKEEENACINPEKILEKIIKIKTDKQLEKLPKYVYPIYSKAKLIGYYVEGFPDHEGKPYEKKEFKECSTTVKALFAVKNYLKELDIKNKDAVFVEVIPDDLIKAGYCGDNTKRKDDATKKLPRNVTYVNVNGKNIGYQINNFQLQGKQIKKKICDTHFTMEKKYNDTLDFLRNLIEQKNQYINNNKDDNIQIDNDL